MKRLPVSVSVIVPTVGRESLAATVASIAPQLQERDELLVIADGPENYERAVVYWPDTIEGPTSFDFGNRLRDYGMSLAQGRLLMFCDDDDVYTPDALDHVRRRCDRHRTRVHLFRMETLRDGLLWGDEEVRSCNVGTPMFVLPNNPARLASWQNPDGPYSDFRFISDTVALHPRPPLFHREIVAHVN